MKLQFKKSLIGETEVKFIEENVEKPFNYIILAKHLLSNKELEPCEFRDGFTAEEIESVHTMVAALIEVAKKNSEEL
jgi:hypothetical protein